MKIKWDDPNPVFFDFETQSAADLKEIGGRLYAEHPSTRILSLVCLIDGRLICWIPSYHFDNEEFKYIPTRYYELIPDWASRKQEIEVYVTRNLPQAISDNVYNRTYIAHNCFGFDRFIWERFISPVPSFWADTIPIAKSFGLPGGLEKVGQKLVDKRKDLAKLIVDKLTPARETPDGIIYPKVGDGQIVPLIRYNSGDVLLLKEIWDEMSHVEVEADVINTHWNINDRGIEVDFELLHTIQRISSISVANAKEQIDKLTNGELVNYKSHEQVKKWLKDKGIVIRDMKPSKEGEFKVTLRKDVVEQCLINPELMIDPDSPIVACVDDIDERVFDVLKLRSQAIRITSAKVDRAMQRVSKDNRIRDLFSYWQAFPGRFSSHGFQIHNLPRPKKGIRLFNYESRDKETYSGLLELYESGLLSYDTIKRFLDDVVENAKNEKEKEEYSKYTVDDCLSALLRPCFRAKDGYKLLIADFNAIEARGTAWHAREELLLDLFRQGKDVYKWMASKIYGKPIESITEDERWVGKQVTLGCCYSMSAEKFVIYCALQGVNLAKANTSGIECVEAFRNAFPEIAGRYAGMIGGRIHRTGGLWSRLQNGTLNVINEGKPETIGRCYWRFNGKQFMCDLPSGRRLYYQNAAIEQQIPEYCYTFNLPLEPKATICYDHPQGYRTYLYGGKITENIVQASARDILAGSMVKCEENDIPPIGHIHDEIIAEVEEHKAKDKLHEMIDIMSESPSWGTDFPVGVEGFISDRYVKSAPPDAYKVKK
jgi:DNA polymerase bacteriophage-type